MSRRPPSSTLFPYTTLSRSHRSARGRRQGCSDRSSGRSGSRNGRRGGDREERHRVSRRDEAGVHRAGGRDDQLGDSQRGAGRSRSHEPNKGGELKSGNFWLTITGPPPPGFHVSVASKGFRISISSLESTLAGGLCKC